MTASAPPHAASSLAAPDAGKRDAGLTGVPETMLWTLHNRASEVRRPDSLLIDPAAAHIRDSIAYDYMRSFGKPNPTHAMRSFIFDRELAAFLHRHPGGTVVNLAEGLETQRFRVPHPDALWITVDLPEGIAIREHFMAADDRHVHLAMSALDRRWFDAVPQGSPVFITAQGLFMYLDPAEVEALFRDMAARFPGGWLAFDFIPRWLSRKTLEGWNITPHYTAPPMPWGLHGDEVPPTLAAWCGAGVEVEMIPWRFPRGTWRWLLPLVARIPPVGRRLGGMVRLRFPPSRPRRDRG